MNPFLEEAYERPLNTKSNNDFRENCLNALIETIENQDFVEENTIKKTGKEFTRKTRLTFRNLVTFISQSITGSVQRELNKFFQKVYNDEFIPQVISKSAFTHARAKLRHEAFIRMNQIVVDAFYANANYKTWKGFRVLAIDGSSLILPRHPSVVKEFGMSKFGPLAKKEGGRSRSIARISLLHDVLNGITLNAEIDSFKVGERELGRRLWPHIKPRKDLLLLDRGYPSFSLFFELNQLGIDYCVRMTDDWYTEINKMANDKDTDKIVTFKIVNKNDRTRLIEKYGDKELEVTCRLIITMLPNGDRVVMCTSLLDEKLYSYENFYEVYHSRWGIEEKLKLYKCRIGMEIFSGKTANAIRQDFFAKIFMATVAAVMQFPVQEQVKKPSSHKSKKHLYQINTTNAVAKIKEFMSSILLKKIVRRVIQAFDDLLQRNLEIVRLKRAVPRGNIKRQPPGMAYKNI